MYLVVGCGDCHALWIVEAGATTSQCPRCQTTREIDDRTTFFRSEDPNAAREARARLLAEQQGYAGAYSDVDDFEAMDAAVSDVGPTDEEYLVAAGIDPETVAEAGERATAGSPSRSRRDIVRRAIRSLDAPTHDAVLAYAADRGVGTDDAEQAIEKLRRAGELSRSGDAYRLL